MSILVHMLLRQMWLFCMCVPDLPRQWRRLVVQRQCQLVHTNAHELLVCPGDPCPTNNECGFAFMTHFQSFLKSLSSWAFRKKNFFLNRFQSIFFCILQSSGRKKTRLFTDLHFITFFVPYFYGIAKHLRHDFLKSWISIYTAPLASKPGLTQCPLFLAMFIKSPQATFIAQC